jgi:hypothetical protein
MVGGGGDRMKGSGRTEDRKRVQQHGEVGESVRGRGKGQWKRVNSELSERRNEKRQTGKRETYQRKRGRK